MDLVGDDADVPDDTISLLRGSIDYQKKRIKEVMEQKDKVQKLNLIKIENLKQSSPEQNIDPKF